MADQPASERRPAHGRGRMAPRIGAIVGLAAGCLIAWMDTRPGWDDTGVTAGALFLAAALSGLMGARWWLGPLLVAGPVLLAEQPTVGSAAFLILAIAVVGFAAGAALRRAFRRG